jgi:hypothetical protein
VTDDHLEHHPDEHDARPAGDHEPASIQTTPSSFLEVDASMESDTEHSPQRLRARRRTRIRTRLAWPLSRFATIALGSPILVVALVILHDRSQAPVDAEELLRDIAVHESAPDTADLVQRIQMHATPHLDPTAPPGRHAPHERSTSGTPFSRVWDVTTGALDPTPSADVPLWIADALEAHHFDWREPLGIARIREWRAALKQKADDITVTSDGQYFLLRTTTEEGNLRGAELLVRRDTHAVVRQMLDFDGIGRVEIEEIARWARGAAPAGIAVPTFARAVDRQTLRRAELDARLLLHEMKLDLRPEIQVSRTPEGIRIDGAVPSAGTRRTLSQRAAALEHVQIAVHAQSRTTALAPIVRSRSFARHLDSVLGHNTPVRAAYATKLVDLVTIVGQRLRILDELSRTFPGRWSAPADADLLRLAKAHNRRLDKELTDLNLHLQAVTVTSPRSQSARLGASKSWQQRTTEKRDQAAALGRLVADLLVREDTSSDDVPSAALERVSDAFNTLWNLIYGEDGAK